MKFKMSCLITIGGLPTEFALAASSILAYVVLYEVQITSN